MAIVAVSISPLGKGVSVGRYVAETQRILDQYPNLCHRLDPMFTTIEGDLDEIMQAIRDMQESVFRAGAVRVSTVIKIDDRRDKKVELEDKVHSVQSRLDDDPSLDE